MVGYVQQYRDLDTKVADRYGLYKGVYGSSLTGGIVSANVLGLITHQRTRSWRSGGINGSQIEDFHQILSANVEQFNWPFDTGHEFTTTKVSGFTLSHGDFTVRGGYNNSYYRGPLIPMDPFPFWNGFNGGDGSNRYTYGVPTIDITKGTKFLRDTLPGKSSANLSQLILETLRDMPRIPFESFDKKLFDRRNLPKNIGSEYLNAVFGWAPLVSDVLKVCESIVKIDDIIAQYQRDAGPEKTVRRTRSLPETRSSAMSVSNNLRLGFPLGVNAQYPHEDLFKNPITGNFDTQPNGFAATRGNLTIETNTFEEYRFVARWMYYLGSDSPVFGELRRLAQLARKTLGIRLDLELLWELAPWTWLSDWFVNIGDVLAVNAALATDSTVLQYAYLMRETQVSVKYTHTGVLLAGRPTGPFSALVTQRSEERVRATPYGFGVNLNSLSATQIAILASLVASGYNGSKL